MRRQRSSQIAQLYQNIRQRSSYVSTAGSREDDGSKNSTDLFTAAIGQKDWSFPVHRHSGEVRRDFYTAFSSGMLFLQTTSCIFVDFSISTHSYCISVYVHIHLYIADKRPPW